MSSMVRLSGGMERGTVWVAVCAAAALLACATTPDTDSSAAPGADRAIGAGEAQELGRVEVESLDDETRIVLTGLEDPAYTVEPTSGGEGLVVELSGVSQPSASLFDALSGGDTQVSVYDGLVDVVSTSTYEGAEAPVTRIEVTFAEPAEYEVMPGADGLGIVVRRGASPLEDPDMLAEADAEAGMDAEASLDASAMDDPWSVAESVGGLETEAEPTSAEAEALWAADNEEPAPSAALETRPSEPATKLSGVAAETTQAGVLLHLQADGMLVNAETFTLEDPARLVIDLPGIASDVQQDKIGIESAWVQRVRIGAHPDKLRVVLDGGPNVAAFQGRRVLPTVDGLVLTVGSGADLDEALAARVAEANQSLQIASTGTPDAPASFDAGAAGRAEPQLAPETSGSGAQAGWDAMAAGEPAMPAKSAGTAPAEIYGLQYDRDDDRDRIAVLADRVVDYEILTPDAETVVVRIENAVIAGSVGERITPELGGPVSLVTT
ncbi:MAG TPA: AMIN domain-containing protein, partial [Alphaproteobacteria bacterium]|nr:AMIN domain-containing protein [Alphaproteobacteria bacterium]